MYGAITGWAVTVDWQAWATFAQALSIFAAAAVAGRTAQQVYWEKSASRQIEVAEEALSIALQATSVFQELRSPLSKIPEEDLELSYGDRLGKDMQRRLDANRPYFNNYFQLVPRVRAYFGADADTAFRIIGELRSEFVSAVNTYVGISGEANRDKELKNMMREAQETMWRIKPDSFDARLEQSQQVLESLLSPYLRKPKQFSIF